MEVDWLADMRGMLIGLANMQGMLIGFADMQGLFVLLNY